MPEENSTSTAREPQQAAAKQRLLRYDMLRILAAFMVIGAHFDTHLPSYLNMPGYPRILMNGWETFLVDGGLAVAIFFMLSGFFSYSSIGKPDFFAKKWVRSRIKRLLIPMWIAWPIGLVLLLMAGSTSMPRIAEVLLGVIGMDGYVGPLLPNPVYGIVGEWYTGAIIVVTMLWPLLRRLMRRFGVARVTGALVAAQVALALVLAGRIDLLGLYRSPLTCAASYCLGCLLAKAQDSESFAQGKRGMVLGAELLAAGLAAHHASAIITDPLARTLGYQLTALAYFVFAEAISLAAQDIKHQHEFKVLKHLINRLAALSYPFYLFQHVVIYFVLGVAGKALGNTPQRALLGVALLAITCLLTLALSELEQAIEKALQKAKAIR